MLVLCRILLEQILPRLNCVWLVSDDVISCFLFDHVIFTGPPDAPTRPTVSKVATTSLKLKWLPPEFDGNSEITTYQVTTPLPFGITWLNVCLGGTIAGRVEWMVTNCTTTKDTVCSEDTGAKYFLSIQDYCLQWVWCQPAEWTFPNYLHQIHH